ncbi:MAG: ATP-grasp domain-containing protein [Victivallales bacterium]|nr:ATP-grasp domain-containing protein [Victivallales bacterium]
MKKALVLAGGIAQVALIEELKNRGYRTLLADMNPNCVAAKSCDEFYPVSAMDIEGIKKLAKEQNVDMVLTACADQIIVAEVEVCKALGLKTYLDLETVHLVSDKHYMKDVFMKNGIPTSRFVVLNHFDQGKIEGLRYPLVVKPVDAYSARGVRKCNNREEVEEFLSEAIEISRTKTAVVEEFVEGDELTVEAFVCKGKATVLCIGSKNKLKNGRFVLSGSLYPAELSTELTEEIKQTTQKISDAFHLFNSPININMITDGKHGYVLEFCARTGGFVKYEITRIMSGFDPIKAIVDMHEGIDPEVGMTKAENRYLMTCYLYCSEGVLDRYEGFEDMHGKGIISRYYLVRNKGHQFKGITSQGDRAAGFFVQDDDYDRLQEKFNTAVKNLKVLDKDGNDLVRRDLM